MRFFRNGVVLTAALVICSAAVADEARWFPVQAAPAGLVRTRDDLSASAGPAIQMMLQSVAGLAARAVNDGRSDEMVWVATGNPDIERWYARILERRPAPELRAQLMPWELVDRYRRSGIIRGYILYRLDRSRGRVNDRRAEMDCSVNVATSVAGPLDGILIDESLEDEARRHGLAMLLDAREKTQAWCFATYKNQLNRRLLCTQDPTKPHIRDLAIAQNTLTLYGDDALTAEAMKWLEPLSPILGWNGGDEFRSTRLSTVHGHFQTATDWCMNLPVLMAGSERVEQARVKRFDPRSIDWDDKRSAVSFVCTDGDNVQWLEGSFFGNRSYWGSPDRGRVPFGWSCCFGHLAQLCPPAIEHAVATRSPNDWFIEWGGGYYYPDLFARERPDRWGLFARHAARTWKMMRASNTRLIGFNVWQPESADARKAYEVFAGATEGLLAILVFQYAPYEGGAGKTFWVKDKNGVELPVITARYSIWEHTNDRPRSGTPAKVAREIRESVAHTPMEELPRYDWVIAHAWSSFRKARGDDEEAENLPRSSHDGVRGYTPVTWCAERLPGDVRVVSPEELVWRIRFKHDPEATRAAVQASASRRWAPAQVSLSPH